MDSPQTKIAVRAGENFVELTVPSDSRVKRTLDLMAGVRETIQGRQPPPPPKGAVGADPTRTDQLREYPEDERALLQKRWQLEAREHDRKLIEEIARAEKLLRARPTELRLGPPLEETGRPEAQPMIATTSSTESSAAQEPSPAETSAHDIGQYSIEHPEPEP
jgi:hypothetical protein